MSEGIEKVQARLRRATALLESAGLPYAVIGGNAVAAWVSRVDDSVVRNTRDVDLLVRREDMAAIVTAMAGGRFHPSLSLHSGRKGPDRDVSGWPRSQGPRWRPPDFFG